MMYRFFDRSTVAKMSVDFLCLSRRDGRSMGPNVSDLNEAYAALQVKT